MRYEPIPAGRRLAVVIGLAFLLPLIAPAEAQTTPGSAGAAPLKIEPARKSPTATQAPIYGAAKAGSRIVAVGDYGTILLSDDGGRTFRQAAAVPVSSTLTAVSFADDRNGWAVGHWGVILNTQDGGEHWSIQRTDTHEDRPLFSVHFFNSKEGAAVGLWSLLLVTRDGGLTWESKTLPTPPDGGKADRNLFKAFASGHGTLFVAAERGMVLRSDDRGRTWQYLNTGYNGSFWSGVAAKDGSLLVGGLRGNLYRSTDDGHSWESVKSGTRSSITDIAETDGRLVAAGLDGIQLESSDHGLSFAATQRDDRLSMTAVVPSGSGAAVYFSRRGPVQPNPPGTIAAR